MSVHSDDPRGSQPDPHDPGPAIAAGRAAEPAPAHAPAAAARVGGCVVRVGTAGWADRLLTARGVFYPDDVKTPEARLRHYASRFSLVEADTTYYALPDAQTTASWVERTPKEFVFDIKAHALLTGHAAEIARLPRQIREALPAELTRRARVYAKDLPADVMNEIVYRFVRGLDPLVDAGKLGVVLLQLAPWVRPDAGTPRLLDTLRASLGTLPLAVEFRHPSWLAPRLRERVWAELRARDMAYVVADTPTDAETSMPIVPAVTARVAVVRLHGRRAGFWGARGASVADKYRYLYDGRELDEWHATIVDLCQQAEEIHVVFNNCYVNYGTTNALELAAVLGGSE
jgi:uncharacterized protein YecE (DUF72 family)